MLAEIISGICQTAERPAFNSVILAEVYDIKNLKSREAEEAVK